MNDNAILLGHVCTSISCILYTEYQTCLFIIISIHCHQAIHAASISELKQIAEMLTTSTAEE